jgi:hypothetical protein
VRLSDASYMNVVRLPTGSRYAVTKPRLVLSQGLADAQRLCRAGLEAVTVIGECRAIAFRSVDAPHLASAAVEVVCRARAARRGHSIARNKAGG